MRCPSAALLVLAAAACGAPPAPVAPPAAAPSAASSAAPARPSNKPLARRDPLVGPHGETAALVGHQIKIVSPSGGEQVIEATSMHPPPGDRSLVGISPTALLFTDDGTLLVGMGDGTIAALDGAGRRRFALGLRGAIRGLAPAGEGLVAVTTQRGVIALMTTGGRLRWERQVTAERLTPPVISGDRRIIAASQRGVFALSQGGEVAFTHASPLLQRICDRQARDCDPEEVPALSLDGDDVVAGNGLRFRLGDPHPAVPSLEPSYTLAFRKVLDGTVTSVVTTGSTEVWALVRARNAHEWSAYFSDGSPFLYDGCEVVRIDGTKQERFSVPIQMPSVGAKRDSAPLETTDLVAGPGGAPWILGHLVSHVQSPTGDSFVNTGVIHEIRGGAVRERKDRAAAFAAHPISYSYPIAAARQGSRNLHCFGDEEPVCAVPGGSGFRLLDAPGKVASVRRIGEEEWLFTDKGEVFRHDGKGLVGVFPGDKTWFQALAGTSERDVWASTENRYFALHFDGTRWVEIPLPSSPGVFFARAADDVWSGRQHWDGRRWSRAFGAPEPEAVLARGRDDVWLGGSEGLWHGTPPGPAVVRLPPPRSPDPGAIDAPPPLPLDAAESAYVVEWARIAVKGDTALSRAKNISASPDGILWFHTWNRLVEVDAGGKATTLRAEGRDSFVKWAYPEAKGRGLIVLGDEIHRIDGQRTVREEVQLEHKDAVAVDGDGRGPTWVVGRSSDDFSPRALVRDGEGFRPVLGLPAASFSDVAAAPDGGAWFAGGLSPGPAGEGILFHARGRLGSEATARYRAPAALLAVTAVGPDEAWAVGAGGTVIHVRGGAVTRYRLESDEWLRAVGGSEPDDVWIGGDGGTLLHYDGRAFHPVSHPLGARAAFTGIAPSQGVIWVVGPSGILRIKRRV